MTIHNSLSYILAVFGLYAGFYILFNMKKIRADWVTRTYFIALGAIYVYTGVVYCLIIMDIITAIPPTQSSIFMRPANILYVAVPFLIARRMGL